MEELDPIDVVWNEMDRSIYRRNPRGLQKRVHATIEDEGWHAKVIHP